MLKKTEKTLINELLAKLEKEIVEGKPTQSIKEDILHLIKEHLEASNKVAYSKGYTTAKKEYYGDWQYDPGDSRG